MGSLYSFDQFNPLYFFPFSFPFFQLYYTLPPRERKTKQKVKNYIYLLENIIISKTLNKHNI